ncbi:MAG: helix-turn-helix domain-containing protein, partial [Rhodoferax sp.]
MSEESSIVSSQESSVVPLASPQTAGSMLRLAREAAGLHVAALAVAMKVPVKKLEALEADRLDLLPDAVFVRALASSVCRALKIDPVPVLAKLPRNRIPKLDTEERGINTPFHVPGESRPWSGKSFSMRPAMFIVLALLVGVALLVFIPEMQAGGDSSPEVNMPVAPTQSGSDAAGPQSGLVLPPTITNQPEVLAQTESAAPSVEIVPAAPAVPSALAVVASVPSKSASAAEVPSLQ